MRASQHISFEKIQLFGVKNFENFEKSQKMRKNHRLQIMDFNFFNDKLKFTLRIPIINEQRIVITYKVEFENSIMHIFGENFVTPHEVTKSTKS